MRRRSSALSSDGFRLDAGEGLIKDESQEAFARKVSRFCLASAVCLEEMSESPGPLALSPSALINVARTLTTLLKKNDAKTEIPRHNLAQSGAKVHVPSGTGEVKQACPTRRMGGETQHAAPNSESLSCLLPVVSQVTVPSWQKLFTTSPCALHWERTV